MNELIPTDKPDIKVTINGKEYELQDYQFEFTVDEFEEQRQSQRGIMCIMSDECTDDNHECPPEHTLRVKTYSNSLAEVYIKLGDKHISDPHKFLKLFERTFPLTMIDSRYMPAIRDETWPRWLCLPLSYWKKTVQKEYDEYIRKKVLKYYREQQGTPPDDVSEDAIMLMFLGTWRYGKGIYEFDKDVYKSLTQDTKLSGNIPSRVLLNLPEYCVYIKTSNLKYDDNTTVLGFWAVLNWRASPEELERSGGEIKTELMVLLNTGQDMTPQDYTLLTINDDTLENCLKDAIVSARDFHIETDPYTFDLRMYDKTRMEADRDLFNHILPLLLYICSEEPEIDLKRKPGVSPQYPVIYNNAKKGPLIFPTEKPKVWEIGFKTGEKIREGIERKLQGQRDGVVPHIRRAHWHGYWKGPRKGEREFIYKWLAPIFVGEGEEYLE